MSQALGESHVRAHDPPLRLQPASVSPTQVLDRGARLTLREPPPHGRLRHAGKQGWTSPEQEVVRDEGCCGGVHQHDDVAGSGEVDLRVGAGLSDAAPPQTKLKSDAVRAPLAPVFTQAMPVP